MATHHIVIIILGLSLILAGYLSFRSWLDHRFQAENLEAHARLSEMETERLRLFTQFIQQQRPRETDRID